MAEDSQQDDQPQDDQTQDDAAEATPPSVEASNEDAVQADAAGSDESDAEAPPTESTAAAGTATTAAVADRAAPTLTGAGRAPAPATGAPEGDEGRPNRRKVREGLVMSIKMDKTAVVGVVERVRHPRYVKTVQRTKKLYAHDPQNDLRVGDRVRVAETRPVSRLKRWRVVEVLERAK